MPIGAERVRTLHTIFHNYFTRGFTEYKPTYQQVTEQVKSTSKTNEYPFTNDMPDLQEILGEWPVTRAKVSAYRLSNRKFGRLVEIDTDDLADDNVGVHTWTIQRWGASAKTHPDKMSWLLLPGGLATKCWDGQPFFSTTHPKGNGSVFANLIGGGAAPFYLLDLSQPMKPFLEQTRERMRFMMKPPSSTDDGVIYDEQIEWKVRYKGAFGYTFPQLAFCSRAGLTEPNFKALRNAMRTQTTAEGRPLPINPTHIVVGSANDDAAEELFEKEYVTGGNGEKNHLFGKLKVIRSPYVENISLANEVAAEEEAA